MKAMWVTVLALAFMRPAAAEQHSWPFAVTYYHTLYLALYHESTGPCAAGGPQWHNGWNSRAKFMCWTHLNHHVKLCLPSANTVSLKNPDRCTDWLDDDLFEAPGPPGPLENEP